LEGKVSILGEIDQTLTYFKLIKKSRNELVDKVNKEMRIGNLKKKDIVEYEILEKLLKELDPGEETKQIADTKREENLIKLKMKKKQLKKRNEALKKLKKREQGKRNTNINGQNRLDEKRKYLSSRNFEEEKDDSNNLMTLRERSKKKRGTYRRMVPNDNLKQEKFMRKFRRNTQKKETRLKIDRQKLEKISGRNPSIGANSNKKPMVLRKSARGLTQALKELKMTKAKLDSIDKKKPMLMNGYSANGKMPVIKERNFSKKKQDGVISNRLAPMHQSDGNLLQISKNNRSALADNGHILNNIPVTERKSPKKKVVQKQKKIDLSKQENLMEYVRNSINKRKSRNTDLQRENIKNIVSQRRGQRTLTLKRSESAKKKSRNFLK
jgi:hypothetical protein